MAKHCDACKKPFPENLEYCPHCGTFAKPAGHPEPSGPEPAKESEEWFEWMEKRHQAGISPEKSSSADFSLGPMEGDPTAPFAAPPPGGINTPDELIEVEPAAQTEGPARQGVGAGAAPPEDVDIMAILAEDEKTRPGTTGEAQPSQVGSAPAASPPERGPRATQVAAGSRPPTKLAHPAEQAKLVADSDPKATHIAAGSSPPTQLAKPEELPDKGSKATQVAAGSSPPTQLAKPEEQDLVQEPPLRLSETSSSGEFELGEAPLPETSSSAEFELGEAPLQETSSSAEFELGEAPAGGGPSGRWLDELEEVEPAAPDEPEAVDVGRLGRAEEDSTVGLEAEARAYLRQGDESSAVDLGSAPTVEMPESELGAIHGTGLRAGDASGAQEQEFDLREEEARAQTARVEEPAAAVLAAAPRGPTSRAAGWLGGGVVGVLIGTAACVGLWATGMEPPEGWRLSPRPHPAPTAQLTAPSTDQPPAAAVKTPGAREDPRTHLERGDFAKVLDDQGAPAEEQDANQSERLAARGEARWLVYLQHLKDPRALNATDAEVVKAKQDLQRANTPEAVFWLGQIQERARDVAGARKTYQEGLQQFKDKPEAQMFQAALDRLDGSAEDNAPAANKPEGKPADTTGARLPRPERQEKGPALWLIALQAAQPEPGKPVPETPKTDKPEAESSEAGSFFWKAVKLAKNQKYDEALSQLERAKTAHESRRFQRLRKSQNPTTDPTEEIFLRSCDELKAYWLMRKNSKEPKSLSDDLKAVIDRLKRDEDVARVDPNVKDVGKDLDLVLAAKREKSDQLKKKDEQLKMQDERLGAIAAALQGAKYVSDKQTDVLQGLAQLMKDREQAQQSLAAAGKLLEPDKYVSPEDRNIAKGVERLLADKKAADTKLETANTQLKSADTKLQTVTTQLKAADSKVETLATQLKSADAKLQTLTTDSKTGDTKLQNLTTLLKTAESKLENATTQLKTTDTKLQTVTTQLKTAEDTLQAVAAKLAAAKAAAPDARGEALVKAIDKLAQGGAASADTKLQTLTAQLKTAEDTLQAVAAKLASAKAVTPDARGEALVKAIDKLAQSGGGGGAPVVPALVQVTGDLTQVGVDVGGRLASASNRTIHEAAGQVQTFLSKLQPLLSGAGTFPIPSDVIPGVVPPADPLGANRYFASGMLDFWGGQHLAAEAEFAEAVRAAGKSAPDARYLYYLGLARLAQGKRAEALDAFRQGNRLERESKPPSAVVSRSLERIQGETRRMLDTYRP
jgi:tetratricopeptide (TPR) repeat protein